MTDEEFLTLLQAGAATLAGAVAADNGEWIIKGFTGVTFKMQAPILAAPVLLPVKLSITEGHYVPCTN